ncbi:MAG: type ISP restriction/modification enzyme, partial [Vicinamibacteria bacterium]
MPDYREALRGIRTFPSLIKFLRDELDWPISSEDFEELTFDYTPEELGIDTANAAKIQEIKRLRPLSANQPWGIFFVKFEPKKLPVVVLRRILSRGVLKKRASANSAERAAWQTDDLLFVSNYGEDEERRISLAHFAQDGQKKDLPTLKVLGWDNLDTPLHLDHVAELLTERLAWPDDEEDEEDWRRQWRSAFTLGHREVITTSKKLSVELAKLARNIRDRINTVLAIETEDGPVTKLMTAFKEALVHDLDEDGFADMYAQTIAYGLLSARVENPAGGTADDFAAQIPATNPFLKELMETFLHVGGRNGRTGSGAGIDFDELGVSEVVELLDHANMEAVVRDFGDRNPQEDPVMHFYELFLKEYDPKEKVRRGVFYTPLPVVSFIVRSVDELLRTEFGLEDGLADTTTWGEMAERHEGLEIPDGAKPGDPFVQILDPATGTGTFLVEVIDVIHRTMTEKWKAEGHGGKINQLWNEYVPTHLLPRLHGYELLMAPYAIAHMKIGLKLYETGYQFGSDARARIYLTNSLEPPQDFSDRLAFAVPALAHEAEAVNGIKRNQRFTVIVGNPPYAGISSNNSEHAVRLVDAYKTVDGEVLDEKKLWLQDDYVKFLRFSQIVLDETQVGLLGFITNHGFLDNPTFRGMRQSLMESFRYIRVLDLHGNANKGERCPDGSADKNVFDIRQGVAISLSLTSDHSSPKSVEHFSLWGLRNVKYQWLSTHSVSSTQWSRLAPNPPYRFLIPRDQNTLAEYRNGYPLEQIVQDRTVGMITARDALTIHFTRPELNRTIKRFAALSPEDARAEFNLSKDVRDWSVARAQEDLRHHEPTEKFFRTVLYRPFDLRTTFYTGTSRGFIGQPQRRIMAHLDGAKNWALCVSRFNRQKSVGYFFVTRTLTDFHLLDTVADSMTVFPLYLFADAVKQTELSLGKNEEPNRHPVFLAVLSKRLGITTRCAAGLLEGLTPEDIFRYAYAVFHSPGYRNRYAEFLKIEFPRLPLTPSMELFRALAEIGGELVALHLMESPKLDDHITTLVGSGERRVEKVSWSDGTVWLDKAETHGFRGVPVDVWNFHIGGYQVCEKWLKDRQAKGGKNPRPGRVLTDDDIAHYQKIVVALNETIRLMQEIDEVIDRHGGWLVARDIDPHIPVW